MANAKSPRARKARKPKLIEIEGHELTEAMYADYERKLGARIRISGNTAKASESALGDFLSDYRPSSKAQKQIGQLWDQLNGVGLAVMTLHDYPWFRPGLTRRLGCELLYNLSQEISRISGALESIAGIVKAEETMHLQGWLKMTDVIEQ